MGDFMDNKDPLDKTYWTDRQREVVKQYKERLARLGLTDDQQKDELLALVAEWSQYGTYGNY
jgi:hypothetical protein